MDHTTVLVSGACGTIGRRIMRVLGGMGIPALAVGYSGDVHNDVEGNSVRFNPLLLLDGPQLEERLETARRNDIHVSYRIGQYSNNDVSPLPFDTIAVVLDANSEEGTQFALDQKLYPVHIPLLVQGGTKLRSEYEIKPFVSAPHSVSSLNYGTGLRRAKHVSCNTTWMSTCFGLFLEGVGDYEGRTVEHVDAVLLRRFADTEESAKRYNPDNGVIKPAEKYGADVGAVMSQFTGKILVRANKNPWRQFHYGIVDVTFDRAVDFDAIYGAFTNYPRGILLRRSLVERRTEDVIHCIEEKGRELGIPDGDIMVPIYSLERLSERSIRCSGLNPQRSIILPGTIDWMWGQQGSWERCRTWSDAVIRTNDQLRWYGLGIQEIKEELERRL